ncbi:MAG: M20/M25/M40 family metallo-hydrolase, partial [Solirubrobacteraceae bacterium]
RGAGAALLATALLAALDIARSPTVPGASDNATGVAALLALAAELAADPLPATEVVLLSAGCEESGMGGMAAYLREHAPDPARTFVLGLDTLGAGTPIQLRAEGVVRAHAYAERDLDRVDAAAAAAGLPAPPRWRLGGWTDPILARFAGLPAVSILSMGGGMIPEYHRPTDTPDRVDWGCVDACLALARAVLRQN